MNQKGEDAPQPETLIEIVGPAGCILVKKGEVNAYIAQGYTLQKHKPKKLESRKQN